MNTFKNIGFNYDQDGVKEYQCNENDCIVFDSNVKSIPASILVPVNGKYAVMFKGINKDLPKDRFGYSVKGEIFYPDNKTDKIKQEVTMTIIGENSVFTAAQFKCEHV